MWKTICGYSVYVEGGKIVRAMKDNDTLPAAVYKWNSKTRVWDNVTPCTVSAFRSGIYRGTYGVF